jgi:hypothetical protein
VATQRHFETEISAKFIGLKCRFFAFEVYTWTMEFIHITETDHLIHIMTAMRSKCTTGLSNGRVDDPKPERLSGFAGRTCSSSTLPAIVVSLEKALARKR